MKQALRNGLIFKSAIFLVLVIIFWQVYHALAQAGWSYEWHWNRVWRYFGAWKNGSFVPGPLCDGLLLTIAITFFGFVLSFALGLMLCFMRLYPYPFCSCFAKLWVEIFRNTPLLLQLFFIYFIISPLTGWGPATYAILTLAFFESAYFEEIFRGALQNIPRQQWEAGLALGFSFASCLRLFILPQAFRHATPTIINQIIAILKDSSLVCAIAVADLTMQAQAIVSETFLVFEVWLLAAFLYLLLASAIALFGFLLERKINWSS